MRSDESNTEELVEEKTARFHIIAMNDAKDPGVTREVIGTGFMKLRACEGGN